MNKEIYVRLHDGCLVQGDSLEAGVDYEPLNKEIPTVKEEVKEVKKVVKKRAPAKKKTTKKNAKA